MTPTEALLERAVEALRDHLIGITPHQVPSVPCPCCWCRLLRIVDEYDALARAQKEAKDAE